MKLGRNLRARALWIPILLAGWSLPGHLLAQARATFKLGEVTAAPGATDVSLPISIEVPPETGFVQAWALAVKYDPAVLAGVVITSTRQTDAFTFVPDGGYAEPGTVSAELYYTVDAWNSPSPGVNSEDDGVIGELRFCVPRGASPGAYPVPLGRGSGVIQDRWHGTAVGCLTVQVYEGLGGSESRTTAECG